MLLWSGGVEDQVFLDLMQEALAETTSGMATATRSLTPEIVLLILTNVNPGYLIFENRDENAITVARFMMVCHQWRDVVLREMENALANRKLRMGQRLKRHLARFPACYPFIRLVSRNVCITLAQFSAL